MTSKAKEISSPLKCPYQKKKKKKRIFILKKEKVLTTNKIMGKKKPTGKGKYIWKIVDQLPIKLERRLKDKSSKNQKHPKVLHKISKYKLSKP